MLTPKNSNLLNYLENLKKNNCQACRLGRTEDKTIVTHRGNLDAKICILGMGPGKEEQKAGIPFIGPSGKLADNIIRSMGLNPDDLFWSNVILHRTTQEVGGTVSHKDRAPAPEEYRTCSVHVSKIIELLNPKVIIVFGKPTLESLLHIEIESGWMNSFCGKEFLYKNIPVFSMLHPAYLLRNPIAKEKAKEHCNVFISKYKEIL